MSIVSLIFSIICAADIITFIVLSWGDPSCFMYYLCRPFWGLIHGKSIGMMIGFLIRMSEIIFAAIVIWGWVKILWAWFTTLWS